VRALLNDCVDQLRSAADRFPWEQPAAYADWIAQTYYYVRHSTRLLAAAAARFPLDDRGNALHLRFGAHLAEEKKHEQLALHDLKRIGFSIADLPEHPATRMFYEPQYFKIEHLCPVALFGYILPLEAIGPSCGPGIIERVAKAHGEKCASFLRLHSDEDVAHLEKAFQALEGVSGSERLAVVDNLHQTTYAYCALLLDIRRRLDTPKRTAVVAAADARAGAA
jgi:Iron-containing redox enzyme